MPTVAWPRRSLTTFGWTFAPRRSVACVCRSFIQFPTRSMPWSLFWPVVAWAAWRRVFVAHGDPERARAWRFLLAWVGVMFIFFALPGGDREEDEHHAVPREEESRAWRFLLAWVGVMFIFFSISAGKRELYMVPAMPAGALLTADALLVLLAQCSAVPRWWTAGAAVVATAAASAGVALVIHPRVADVDLPRLLGVVLVAITAASAIAWWRLGRVRAPALRRVGVMVAAIFAVELWMFQLVYPSIDGEQSAQGIARAAAARVPPGGSVGALSSAPLVAALRYCGGKPVELIESADSMRSFLARGGRVIVAEAGKLDNVRSVAPMRITERVWSGDRTLFVLTPLDDGANERRADAPAGR